METLKETIRRNVERLLSKDKRPASMSEIAIKLKVSTTTLSRWKSGENTPEVPNLESLAKVLSVDPMEFFRTEPQPTKVLPMSEVAKRIAAVPDEVYDLAQKLTPDHEAWEIVIGQMEIDVAKEEKKKARAAEEEKKRLG